MATFPMRSGVVVASALLTVALFIQPAFAQGSGPFWLDMTDIVVGAAQISEASEKARSGSGGQTGDRLEQARRRFWNNYPDGPEIADAATEFATVLLGRDLALLHMYLPEGPDGPRVRVFDALVSLADGGVPASALFLDWVRKVREHLGVRGTQFIVPSPAQFLSAIGASAGAYEKYRIARDFAEFDRESRDPSWVTDGRTFALMSLMRGRRLPPHEAAAEYQVLITLFGASTVDGAGERLRRARRQGGMLQDLAGLGLASDRAVARMNAFAPAGHVVVQGPSLLDGLIAVMAKSDPRVFLARSMHDSTESWRPTAEGYERWTAAVGEQVLLETVRKVMAAPVRYSGLLQVPELEREHMHPLQAVEWLLARQHPAEFARLAVAHDRRTADPRAIMEGYERLRALQGEAALLAAVRDVSRLVLGAPDKLSTQQLRLVARATTQTHGLLVDVLSGTVELGISGIDTSQVLSPRYVSWAVFQPGATVVYQQRSWTTNDPGPGYGQPSRRPVAIDRTLSTGEETWVLQSVADDRVLVRTTRMRATTGRPQVFRPLEHGIAATGHRDDLRRPWIDDMNLGGRGQLSEATGEEPCDAGGQTVPCRWMELASSDGRTTQTTTVWVSDAVPGGLVRRLLKTSGAAGTQYDESRLARFTGQRSAGAQVSAMEALSQVYPVGGSAGAPPSSPTSARPGSQPDAAPPDRVPDSQRPPRVMPFAGDVIPAGTRVVARIAQGVDGRTARIGATFRAALSEPLDIDGRIVAPTGSPVFLKYLHDRSRVFRQVETYIVLDSVVIENRRIPPVAQVEPSAALAPDGARAITRGGTSVSVPNGSTLTFIIGR